MDVKLLTVVVRRVGRDDLVDLAGDVALQVSDLLTTGDLAESAF